MVIFSHRYLGSNSINVKTIPGCLLPLLNIIKQHRHHSSTFFNGASTMLNNVFNTDITCIIIISRLLCALCDLFSRHGRGVESSPVYLQTSRRLDTGRYPWWRDRSKGSRSWFSPTSATKSTSSAPRPVRGRKPFCPWSPPAKTFSPHNAAQTKFVCKHAKCFIRRVLIKCDKLTKSTV